MPQDNIYVDGSYLERNPTWHEEDTPWKAAQALRMLERQSIRPKTVCEVGCGTGGILLRMADQLGEGVAFTGYELSPQAHALSVPRERPNVRFLLRDLLADGEPRFDLVMAMDVFEHVEDFYGFLRRLRPKGAHTLFHIPLDLSVQMVLRGSPLLKVRHDVGHIHYFTKETALAALRDTGYTVVDHFYTAGSLELANRGWRASLLRLPRRLGFALSPDLTVRILGGYSLLVLAR